MDITQLSVAARPATPTYITADSTHGMANAAAFPMAPAETAWDMIQGVTAHARSIGNTDQRLAMEKVGQQIMEKVMVAA